MRIDRQDRVSDRDFNTTNVISPSNRSSYNTVVDKPGLFEAAPIALARWSSRQWSSAALGTIAIGSVIGLSTVLIPNRWFGREIDSVAWNYPVWIIVSVLSGMLFATYVQPGTSTMRQRTTDPQGTYPESPGPLPTGPQGTDPRSRNGDVGAPIDDSAYGEDRRESGLGMVGAVLGWFAVGCPVCNKIALVALGYTGALRWFAPFQPLLAVTAIVLSTLALLLRLRGQIWCPVPATTSS